MSSFSMASDDCDKVTNVSIDREDIHLLDLDRMPMGTLEINKKNNNEVINIII